MNENSLFNPKWINAPYNLIALAYYYRTWNGFEMPVLHQHNHIEIMYVQSAKCQVIFEEETIFVTKGHFVIIDAGVPHKLVVDQGVNCRMLNIEFAFRECNPLNLILPFSAMVSAVQHLSDMLNTPFTYKILSDTDGLDYLLRQLIRTSDEVYRDRLNGNENDLYMQSLYFQLFAEVARLIRSQSIDEGSRGSLYIEEALQFIHDHYDQPFRINDIADRLGIHQNYLQRLFRNNKQQTIISYIRNLRLNKARMLLENTQIPIQEITELIGLDSRQYFTKIFRDQYGISPKAFRKAITTSNWDY